MAINQERKRSLVLLGFLVFILCFSGYLLLTNIHNGSSEIELESDVNVELEHLERPRVAASWTLTSNITIDDLDATYNWDWAVSQAWCSGSGTYGDPYVIENVTIHINNTLRAEYAAVNISNSEKYFTLNGDFRNNASDYGIGIGFSNVTHGTIISTTTSNNGDDGIYITGSTNITITSCTSESNHHHGILLDDTTISLISGGDYNLNTQNGIYFTNATYNDILGGVDAENNTLNGIYFADSDYNDISGSSDIYNNTNHGIILLDSDNCTIINNNIADNLQIGVLIEEGDGNSLDNTVYANDFDGNIVNNARDNGTVANSWDDGVDAGNEWGDYGGVDSNDDGIGDTPYAISGSAPNAQDNYPVWNDGDDIAPAITIVAPTTNQIFADSPSFSLTIVEAVGIFNRWYTLNGGANNQTFTGTSGTITATEWGRHTGLPGQRLTIIITFYGNDTSANIGSASVTIKKQIPGLAIEHGEDDETVYTYALSQNQIFILAGFAFALSLILKVSIIRGKER